MHRHYPEAVFHRLDVELQGDVGLDAIDQLGELREVGERLAATIDWPAILEGREDRFRVGADRTLPREYCATRSA